MSALAANLAARLAVPPPPPLQSGDDYWAERSIAADGAMPPDIVPAAVLIAFVDRPRPTVILTRRQVHLAKHSGQVAFPGGRQDPGDADAAAAALREAWEEITLPPDAVTVLGTGDPYHTVTRYRVTPVIGVIPPSLPLVPNPDEVAHIFEVEAAVLFDPANHRQQAVEWEGRMRQYFEITGGDERIWGATAGIIRTLGARLRLDGADGAALLRGLAA